MLISLKSEWTAAKFVKVKSVHFKNVLSVSRQLQPLQRISHCCLRRADALSQSTVVLYTGMQLFLLTICFSYFITRSLCHCCVNQAVNHLSGATRCQGASSPTPPPPAWRWPWCSKVMMLYDTVVRLVHSERLASPLLLPTAEPQPLEPLRRTHGAATWSSGMWGQGAKL